MNLKKMKVAIVMALVIAIASSVTVFACTLYRQQTRSNTATTYYWKTGGTTTTFSWDNSNYHPDIYYAEYYNGYVHSGTLYSLSTSTGPLSTYYPTRPNDVDWIKYTQQTYTTVYDGYINNPYCSLAK